MERQEISKLAETIAQQYNPEGLSPFPFEKILKENNDLKIVYPSNLNQEDSLSGAIIFDKEQGKYYIVINPNKPKTRQYFTTAHEIGHYFLHKEEITKENGFVDSDHSLDISQMLFRLDDGESTRLEIEANNFAASLIMPQEFVKKAWDSFHDVEECANIFKVSVAAMSVRLERLGLIT